VGADILQSPTFFCYYQNNKGNGEWTWCAPFNGFFGSNPRAYGYIKDKKGRVRSILPNDLTYSPEWIAYQKTGACEALSILFNETANRSGFISRIVCSKNEKVGHFWNEVMINNEWKYFDVQRYGQVKNTDESSFWSGNRSDYGKKIRVFIFRINSGWNFYIRSSDKKMWESGSNPRLFRTISLMREQPFPCH